MVIIRPASWFAICIPLSTRSFREPCFPRSFQVSMSQGKKQIRGRCALANHNRPRLRHSLVCVGPVRVPDDSQTNCVYILRTVHEMTKPREPSKALAMKLAGLGLTQATVDACDYYSTSKL